MVIQRGQIWWAEMDDPIASEPGYTRPVLILQANWANKSRLRTVTVASFTSNTTAAEFPGNVLVQPRDSGLPKPSVVNISQVSTLDRDQLREHAGQLPPSLLRTVDDGLRLFFNL